MRKNILFQNDVNILIERVNNLKTTTKCIWGSMSSTTMLYHCNVTNNSILNGKLSGKKSTLKQILLKHFILNIKREIPKGIKGNPKYFPTETTNLLFEEQQNKWIHIITQFPSIKKSLDCDHPVFGRLNTKEWGRFIWLHMDHHLKQFGV